ncbi:MAG: hypothetical protein Q9160_007505 [Pyrenula sp. 1 TL-2023]
MSEPTPSVPAAPAAAHHYNFTVRMTCSGCSGAVDRVLKRMDGLNSYNVDLETKKVDVYTDTVGFADVLEKIKKTGKAVEAAEEDGKSVDV